MASEETKQDGPRNYVHKAMFEQVRAERDELKERVERARFEAAYIDAAIAGFSGCVSEALAKQLKGAIAFAREQARTVRL